MLRGTVMISPEDKRIMAEAIAYADNNAEANQFEKGYSSALKAVMAMLTNRSNTQRYRVGQDSLTLFRIRQRKMVERNKPPP
jgi:hypothetical protein